MIVTVKLDPKIPIDFSSNHVNLALRTALAKLIDRIRQAVLQLTPIYTGLTRSSISSVIKGSSLGLEGAVFSPLRRASVVELGRPPGKAPNVEAITPWVVAKIGYARLAYVVARAIGERGIPGVFMFKKAAEKFSLDTFANDFIIEFKK